jgi:hypothetical protein
VLFTSAKTGYHVYEAFVSLIKSCVKLKGLIPIPLKKQEKINKMDVQSE